jgi:hypothetical protein
MSYSLARNAKVSGRPTDIALYFLEIPDRRVVDLPLFLTALS